jgi:rhomboid protease GluP
MFNDPPPERRKPHPLEREPVRQENPVPPSQRVTLHIPSVSPTVTYVLIAINVLVFIVRLTSPELNEQIFLWGALHPPDVLENGELYRLVSSMFLHASVFGARGTIVVQNSLHIIFNMYILYAVGTQIERLFGHVRFFLVYLLGGLAGSVLSVVLSDANVYSVGASGAVFAILAAEFVYLYQHRKLLGAQGRAQMRGLVIMAVFNLLFGALSGVSGAALRIDNWGHIGGMIGGLALAWFIGPIFIVRRHPEQPNALLGEDINPLRNRYWALSLYIVALMAILIIFRWVV